ncbi:MAG: hypothetical protein ABJB74_17745 [Gemmatimonas sp.]
MTGSTRLINPLAHSVRAPYAAPQPTGPSTLQPTRNFDPETGAAIRLPAPFIPREFRASLRSDVTVGPPVEQVQASNAFATHAPALATPIAPLFSDDAAPSADFTAFLESHDLDSAETSDSTELPWIDAFAAEAPETDESWPLGEAGKRLDELTQSLSSLDASRERMQVERQLSDAPLLEFPESALPMWNEEEWIDIMPPSSADLSLHEELSQAGLSLSAPDNSATNREPGADAMPSTLVNAESAARALESLAQRVRNGELQVPAFSNEVGQEAMLAGLLASMLGWRQ